MISDFYKTEYRFVSGIMTTDNQSPRDRTGSWRVILRTSEKCVRRTLSHMAKCKVLSYVSGNLR